MTLDRPFLPTPRLYALAAIAAPVLLLASTVAYLTAGEGINDGVLGGTIGVWSSFALIFAFIGIARTLEPVAPRAATVLLVISVIGMTAGVGFNVQAIHQGYFGQDFLNTVDGGSDLVGLLAFLPWGWLAPVTFVTTGILVLRTKVFPAWTALPLIVGGVLFVSARPAQIDVLAVLGDVSLVIGLIPVGLAMLSAPRERAVARV